VSKAVLYHLPTGHLLVSIRSFPKVEHPHLRQRPVPRKPCTSHNSQARQISSLLAKASGVANGNPCAAHLAADPAKDAAIVAVFMAEKGNRR
jgi:hypothetical protein